MNFDSMSAGEVASLLGQRIERIRLQKNITQQELADEIGVTRMSYRALVRGKGKFENWIAVIQALERFELLEYLSRQLDKSESFAVQPQHRKAEKQRKRARPQG